MIKPNPDIIPFVLSEIHLDKNGGNIIGLKYDTMKPSDKCISVADMIKGLENWMKGNGKKVKELCYFDLMADYHYCCGLYFFFTRTEGILEIQYIGKTTSRAIVDRIGAHLDLRASGFLNCFIKRVASLQELDICQMNSLLSSDSVVNQIGEMLFMFIPVYNPVCQADDFYKRKVGMLESLLIKEFNPQYNKQAVRKQKLKQP